LKAYVKRLCFCSVIRLLTLAHAITFSTNSKNAVCSCIGQFHLSFGSTVIELYKL
jgi:hypothetical protein